MTLTKQMIIEIVHKNTNFPQREARELVEMILEEMKLSLEDGQEIKISGFGKWTIRDKEKRPGRNPFTGQTIEITARRIVTFQPSEKLREALNNPETPSPLKALLMGPQKKTSNKKDQKNATKNSAS